MAGCRYKQGRSPHSLCGRMAGVGFSWTLRVNRTAWRVSSGMCALRKRTLAFSGPCHWQRVALELGKSKLKWKRASRRGGLAQCRGTSDRLGRVASEVECIPASSVFGGGMGTRYPRCNGLWICLELSRFREVELNPRRTGSRSSFNIGLLLEGTMTAATSPYRIAGHESFPCR